MGKKQIRLIPGVKLCRQCRNLLTNSNANEEVRRVLSASSQYPDRPKSSEEESEMLISGTDGLYHSPFNTPVKPIERVNSMLSLIDVTPIAPKDAAKLSVKSKITYVENKAEKVKKKIPLN